MLNGSDEEWIVEHSECYETAPPEDNGDAKVKRDCALATTALYQLTHHYFIPTWRPRKPC